jgi:hypothetical protein
MPVSQVISYLYVFRIKFYLYFCSIKYVSHVTLAIAHLITLYVANSTILNYVSLQFIKGVKRPGPEAGHSPPSSAEVKNAGAIPPPIHGVVLS